MSNEPFEISFGPAKLAVNLLAAVARDAASPHQQRAQEALDRWRVTLATPEHIGMVNTTDEHEIDDHGACVSESDDGFFIQTWTWVECDMNKR